MPSSRFLKRQSFCQATVILWFFVACKFALKPVATKSKDFDFSQVGFPSFLPTAFLGDDFENRTHFDYSGYSPYSKASSRFPTLDSKDELPRPLVNRKFTDEKTSGEEIKPQLRDSKDDDSDITKQLKKLKAKFSIFELEKPKREANPAKQTEKRGNFPSIQNLARDENKKAQELQTKLEARETEIQKLQRQVEDLKGELATKTEDTICAALKKENSVLQETAIKFSNLKERYGNMLKDVIEFKNEYQKLAISHKSLLEELKLLKTRENESKEKKVDSETRLEQSLKEQTQKYFDLKKECDSRSLRISELESSIRDLKVELKNTNDLTQSQEKIKADLGQCASREKEANEQLTELRKKLNLFEERKTKEADAKPKAGEGDVSELTKQLDDLKTSYVECRKSLFFFMVQERNGPAFNFEAADQKGEAKTVTVGSADGAGSKDIAPKSNAA